MCQVHELVLESPDFQEKILTIHSLAREIFEPEVPKASYAECPTTAPQMQVRDWIDRLKLEAATILYVTASSSQRGPGRVQEDQILSGNGFVGHKPLQDLQTPCRESKETHDDILGFLLCHPRALGESESYHIFLAGIRQSVRGRGLFPLLLHETELRAAKAGHRTITIATVPHKFPKMYAVLCRPELGWQVVAREDFEGIALGKAVFKKQIGGLSLLAETPGTSEVQVPDVQARSGC